MDQQRGAFELALVVEDLEESRRWLADLLPEALPSLRRVDTAASVAEARELMRANRYPLAIVDWGLPDGTGEEVIRELMARAPEAAAIVATIHDDDAHVFPALRAGASGYVLKSRPRDEVVSQLRRIETEPALSPSIALRVLRHFRASPAPGAFAAGPLDDGGPRLTQREVDVLRLIAKGYRSSEAAALLGLTAATVASYVRDIYRKLGISSRAEAAMEAARRGLVA